jgi:hypothetical protein
MVTTTRSLRSFLQGSLNDFAESCEMGSLVTATSLTSLVILLANLREEGTELTPEVYLCGDVRQALKLLPDRDIIIVGSASDALSAISLALKKCGPLAIGGWNIYVSAEDGSYQFGLFRGSLNPLSISVNETFFSTSLESIKIVRLLRTAAGCIELSNSASITQCILLNDRQESDPKPNSHAQDLPKVIFRDIPITMQEQSSTYLGNTLTKALNMCHGALIAVTKRNTVPAFLKDGVILIEPLDLAKAVANKSKPNSDVAHEHRLTAYSSLIEGMINSDGITVFNTKGKLLAYNCFIKSKKSIGGKPIVGGARTRAYSELQLKLGHGIDAAFIQSQDGWTNLSKEII